MHDGMFDYPDIRDNSIINRYVKNNSRNICSWSDEIVDRYVNEMLEDLLSYVYKSNKYYKQVLDLADYDIDQPFNKKDFRKIPILEKKQLSEDPHMILCVDMKNVAQIHVSTGTTKSAMIYMMYTFGDLYTRDGSIHYYPVVNIQRGDIVANAMPYEMSSSGLSFHRVIQNFAKTTVIPVGKGGYYSDPLKTLNIIKEMKCNKMFTTPSYAARLAQVASENGICINKDFCLEDMWLTGEGCSDAFRKKIESIWGCRGHFYYGSLECGVLGIECPEHNGYHLANASVLVEILDVVTGEVLEFGEIGEIVVTTLTREACPFIRYATGDIGYIEIESCACGYPAKRLCLRGRKNEQIEYKGKFYSPFYIEQFLMECPEVGYNYRYILYDEYIEIQVSLNPEYVHMDQKTIADRIASYVEFGAGIPNKVTFLHDFKYDGGKIKRIIDKRTQSQIRKEVFEDDC